MAWLPKPLSSFCKYSRRASMSSAGRLYGSHTGSPTKYLFALMKFCVGEKNMKRIFALGWRQKIIGFLIKLRITYVHVQSKSVVNSGGNYDHVPTLNFNSDPTLLATRDKKFYNVDFEPNHWKSFKNTKHLIAWLWAGWQKTSYREGGGWSIPFKIYKKTVIFQITKTRGEGGLKSPI